MNIYEFAAEIMSIPNNDGSLDDHIATNLDEIYTVLGNDDPNGDWCHMIHCYNNEQECYGETLDVADMIDAVKVALEKIIEEGSDAWTIRHY